MFDQISVPISSLKPYTSHPQAVKQYNILSSAQSLSATEEPIG